MNLTSDQKRSSNPDRTSKSDCRLTDSFLWSIGQSTEPQQKKDLCQSFGLEGLGGPSEKTSLLGGVVQTLYTPKAIPMSSRCGTICLIQIPSIPLEQRTKSLPASLTIFILQAQLFSYWKIKCSIEIQFLHHIGEGTSFVKHKL